jgi:GAF domain-containing protein
VSDPAPLSLGDLARLVVTDEPLDSTLQRVAELATREIDGCRMAGITLMRNGKAVTAAFTDAVAPEIDTAQYRTGAGPCLQAFQTNSVLRIDDTRTDTRWPEFARAASEHGVLSTLSLPLIVGANALGALNLYSMSPNTFTNDDSSMVFALQASVVLANAQAFWAARHLADQLENALTSRAVIEQAKGVLLARTGCSLDEAFDLLRVASQHQNRKLRDVAAEVVQTAVDGTEWVN